MAKVRPTTWIATSAVVVAGVVAALITGQAHAGASRYFYDALGRVIGTTTETAQIKSYRYDGADNRAWVQQVSPTPPSNSQFLSKEQFLLQGQVLVSADGKYAFALQTDGNLVLYGPNGAMWTSNTANHPTACVEMQADGNLVIYDAQWNPLWTSNTGGHPGALLVVQTDGNVVIYDGHTPVWYTGTTVG